MKMFYEKVHLIQGLSDEEKSSILGICSNCLLYPNNTKEKDPNFWRRREIEYLSKTVSKNINTTFPINK